MDLPESVRSVTDPTSDFHPELIEFFLRARRNILGTTQELTRLTAALNGMMAVGALPGLSFFVKGRGPVSWEFALIIDHFGREVAVQLREGAANPQQESEAVNVYLSAVEQYLEAMSDGSILELYDTEVRRLSAQSPKYDERTNSKRLSKLLHDWVSVCWALERRRILDSDCRVVTKRAEIPISRSTFGDLLIALLSKGQTDSAASNDAFLQRELTLFEQPDSETETIAALGELVDQAERRASPHAEPFSQLSDLQKSLEQEKTS